MAVLISPTGGGIRNDAIGSGYFHARRGSRRHDGCDFALPQGIGQQIVAPITGLFKRTAYPYTNDTKIRGGIFVNGDIKLEMFYFDPIQELIGKSVTMGEVVGVAQDLGKKHPGIESHIHLGIIEINPLILL